MKLTKLEDTQEPEIYEVWLGKQKAYGELGGETFEEFSLRLTKEMVGKAMDVRSFAYIMDQLIDRRRKNPELW